MSHTSKKDDTASVLRSLETGNRLLDKQEVLELYRLSSRTLQRWRTEYQLKHTKVGKKIYYDEGDIQDMLKRFQVHKKKQA